MAKIGKHGGILPSRPETAVVFLNARDMPQDEEGKPRYSALCDALQEYQPFDAAKERKLRTAAIIAIKTLRHEVEDRGFLDDAIREIKQLRQDVAAAKESTAGQAKERRSKALRIAQDRVAALEVELSAWKAEPLISRIWRAWRGI
jgi:hypothetical protein